jgi:hypothetical protein
MSHDSSETMGRLQSWESSTPLKADRTLLRLSGTHLFVGVALALLAGIFHPDREPANTHSAAFAEYANSAYWTAVHLGQFAGMTIMIAGLLVLYFALNVRAGMPVWIGRFGVVAAGVTITLYGVLQVVDGVALKQAADAWVRASDVEREARFASAEAIRWLEWGVRSYHSVMLGLSLILFGAVIVATARIPRSIGYIMGLSGLAYIVQGWIIGSEGFSASNLIPTLLGIILIVVWSIGLLIVAWRMQESAESPAT